MKTIRRLAVPAVVLLSACGGDSGDGVDGPGIERPGSEAPAQDDATTGQPSAPATPPSAPATAPGQEPDAQTGPDGAPGAAPESGTDPDDGSGPDPDLEPEAEPGSESPPAAENPSVPDPMSRGVTSVTFEITVPAHVSNELQVRIMWGETTLSAAWIGDESWSATVDLPTDEERLLVVDFLDRNGALPLGTFERDFRTGTNAAETYTIGPGNFDTARWDSDSDGASNLEELHAGTDPLSGDTAPAPIDVRPTGEELTPLGVIERVSAFYEAPLPKTRPYVRSVSIRPDDPEDYAALRRTVSTEIDVDASGTGSYSSFVETRNAGDEDVRRTTLEATRTVGDGVRWSGTYAWSVSSAGLSEDIAFATRTEAVGERVSQRGTIAWDPRFWERSGRTDIEFELLGERIDGSALCAPVAGRVTVVEATASPSADPSAVPVGTTISRAPADPDWQVETRYADGSLQGVRLESLDVEFYCEFGDL